MAYLIAGGAEQFKDDTSKRVKVGLVTVKLSGSNLVPIIDALRRYEAVMGAFGVAERQRPTSGPRSICARAESRNCC